MFVSITAAFARADWYWSWIFVSMLFTAAAFYPYVRNLWKAEDDLAPTISGWFSWMLSDATIFAAQLWTAYQSGIYGSVGWQNAIYVIGPLVVIALSMRKGTLVAKRTRGQFTWRDAFRNWDCNENGEATYKGSACVCIVAMALLAWTQTDNALYAIGFTTLSTIVGTSAVAWPLRLDPYGEHFWAWVLFLIGGVCGLVAVKDALWPFDWVNAYPPILFLCVQVTLVTLTARRYTRRFAKP